MPPMSGLNTRHEHEHTRLIDPCSGNFNTCTCTLYVTKCTNNQDVPFETRATGHWSFHCLLILTLGRGTGLLQKPRHVVPRPHTTKWSMASFETRSSTITTLPPTKTLVVAKCHIRGTALCIMWQYTITRHSLHLGRMDLWCPQDTSHLVQDLVSLNPSDSL